MPHGVYDDFGNAGFMTLGTSRETSAFVCDAISLAWQEGHQAHYPEATEILLTFDCGGANAARSLRFKEDMIALSGRLGLPLRVAHCPPIPRSGTPLNTAYSATSSAPCVASSSIATRPRSTPFSVPARRPD